MNAPIPPQRMAETMAAAREARQPNKIRAVERVPDRATCARLRRLVVAGRMNDLGVQGRRRVAGNTMDISTPRDFRHCSSRSENPFSSLTSYCEVNLQQFSTFRVSYSYRLLRITQAPNPLLGPRNPARCVRHTRCLSAEAPLYENGWVCRNRRA